MDEWWAVEDKKNEKLTSKELTDVDLSTIDTKSAFLALTYDYGNLGCFTFFYFLLCLLSLQIFFMFSSLLVVQLFLLH